MDIKEVYENIPCTREDIFENINYSIKYLVNEMINYKIEYNLDTNEGVAINPICFIRPFGTLIWGNRTMKNNGSGTTSGTTALSFLNVRNLVSELKKVLYRTARGLTFEPNSDVLWVNFSSLIYPVLDRMLAGNGISGYKLIKQATPAKARLKASIRIVPIEAVEDFELSVVLEDEGTVTVQ
jgi:phage tail sheath protein FI